LDTLPVALTVADRGDQALALHRMYSALLHPHGGSHLISAVDDVCSCVQELLDTGLLAGLGGTEQTPLSRCRQRMPQWQALSILLACMPG
jgi:hypothetical protein